MKRALAFVLAGATLMLTACGKLPEAFPGISEDPTIVNMNDRYEVNVFFQNNENTYALSKGGTAFGFIEDWTAAVNGMMYMDTSRTYITDYDPASQQFSLKEYKRADYGDLQWEEARKQYAAGGSHADDDKSFYVMEGKNGIVADTGKNDAYDALRQNGGILRLFVDEVKKVDVMRDTRLRFPDAEENAADAASEAVIPEEEMTSDIFNPDAINVIFTDLSENKIIDLGEELFDYYTADNRYSACVMAVKLEMNAGDPIYYTARGDDDVLIRNQAGNSRWFYLLMLGPSTHLSTFVDNMKNKIENGQSKMNEGGGEGGYQCSVLYNTDAVFDRDADIEVHMANHDDPDQVELIQKGGPDAIFENASVRLEPLYDRDSAFPVGIYRDSIMEYHYTAKDKAFNLKGYHNSSTKDFSLNIDLTKEAESEGLDYVFGDPVVYLEGKKGWEEMDPDHKERFFKTITAAENDSRKLSIISDNADECDHHNVYITVPVLQRATVSQVVGEEQKNDAFWVTQYCSFVSSDPADEVKRTLFFNVFYANLFDMKLEGEKDAAMLYYDDTKYLYAQIDEVKILIEGVH